MNTQLLTPHQFFASGAIRTDSPTLLEIGDVQAIAARAFFEVYPAGRAVIVEADSENYRVLQAAATHPNIRTVHAALSDHDGPVDIYRYDRATQSSLFALHRINGTPLVATARVDGYTLRSLLALASLAHVDVMLANAEGAELYALREIAADAGLSARIDQICISLHHRGRMGAIYSGAVACQALAALSRTHELIRHATRAECRLLVRREAIHV